jgi:solute carrier family 25 carnitine/acylcarnitine transporter 20/29
MDPGLVDYLAGVAGGVAVCFVGHPFDTIKTRLQTSPDGFYSGSIDCIRQTWKREGFWGFYSGVMSPLAGQMFFRAASFFTFYRVQAYFVRQEGGTTSDGSLFIAGGITGLVISAIETPIDLVKTKLQIQVFRPASETKYTNVTQACRWITTNYGARALWQGWSATAIRNIPANAVFFPTNEIMKGKIAANNNIAIKDLELHHRLIAGATGGACYWIGMYPLDRIKGVVQAQRFRKQVPYLEVVRMIIKTQGLIGLYKGLGACAARSAPACASMFAVVDCTRQYLGGGDQ